jgi:hypothetical protein
MRCLCESVPGRRHTRRHAGQGPSRGSVLLYRSWGLRFELSHGRDHTRVRVRATGRRDSSCRPGLPDKRPRPVHRRRTWRHGPDQERRGTGTPGHREHYQTPPRTGPWAGCRHRRCWPRRHLGDAACQAGATEVRNHRTGFTWWHHRPLSSWQGRHDIPGNLAHRRTNETGRNQQRIPDGLLEAHREGTEPRDLIQ